MAIIDANIFNMLTTIVGWFGGAQALGIAECAFEIVLDYTGTRKELGLGMT